MNFLIQHRCTGNAVDFAQKLNLSRSTLFNYLEYMREDLGIDILYDKSRGTYYYDGVGLCEALGGLNLVHDGAHRFFLNTESSCMQNRD